MLTRVKTAAEIAAMRESGRMLATVHAEIKKFVRPGCSGLDVSELCKRELKGMGATAPFLGYLGFPDVICISVNDEVVHGIPNAIPFKENDLVSFDFGVTYQGMITDSAFSMLIGKKAMSNPNNKQVIALMQATEASLDAGIEVVRAGARIGDIGAAVQEVLDAGRYGIVRELVGHGVGHQVHEDPDIPNYGRGGTGMELKAGMTIAIEPMATLGDRRVLLDADEWTVRTRDGSLAAHFEHTVLVTPAGAEVLTRLG
ncbi:type I methionyl aminopeptidase [Candidatus Saccharibacteria bacterium]|nr:type I methionyl aminopeptidase [Candidatus Saccharibacteria bacterium]